MSNKLKIELKSSNEIINNRFKKMKNFSDIAELLEVPVELLWKILIKNKEKNYRMSKIRKKNGDERTIYSPSNNLAILQKKLVHILTLNFNSHHRSHGFVKKRSIVSNAAEHVNQRFVLNFDLENFFESIKFRRVRHMFLAYFKFNDKVASTLSNICCHPEGFLPQGASTSPIISNILAKSLDKEFTKLAQHTRGCRYTRYADDITFSTNRKLFPKEIAFLDNGGKTILNEDIINIIDKYGFKLNPEKTRMNNWEQNQSVTGIVVNEKLNINRTYIRRIRSILNSIEKNVDNLNVAIEIFESKYPFREKKKGNKPDMFSVLKGMISHVGHVKGKKDAVYLKLAKRFNEIALLNDFQTIKLPLSNIEYHEKYTYIIDDDDFHFFINKNGNLGDFVYGQGTGFLLKGIGIITNYHVISDAIDILESNLKFTEPFNIAFYTSDNHCDKRWAKIINYHIKKDIAILEIDDMDISSKGYSYSKKIKSGQSIELIGFPNYRKGQDIRITKGEVQGIRIHEDKYERYEISTTIYGGNSGGPIVNKYNEVIGVAVKGATLEGVSPNEIIPISEVIQLINKP